LVKGVEAGVMDVLTRYDWPGNVRELENVIERAFALCDGEYIGLEHLPDEIVMSNDEGVYLETETYNLACLEALWIRKALIATAGNKRRAAEMLGISRKTLYRKMREYGIPMDLK